MIRILGTIFAGLLGLCFGSFLNVCLSRWPEGESVVRPRSHCRDCCRELTWSENIPVVSWLILRGRCCICGALIGWRYPLVELAVALLWGNVAWGILGFALNPDLPAISLITHFNLYNEWGAAIGKAILYWLLVALAVLDAENLWLPDWLTLPGIFLGITSNIVYRAVASRYSGDLSGSWRHAAIGAAFESMLAILAAAALILLIRVVYWLIRGRDGIGLGDAKLMAMLAAWLGLPGALLTFVIGVVLGAIIAIALLVIPSARSRTERWANNKLPLGTFLCIGGIVSSLWGQPIIAAYLRWSGF
jgi:leader peptidase (prepilin peptidase)/N-methyltransferase